MKFRVGGGGRVGAGGSVSMGYNLTDGRGDFLKGVGSIDSRDVPKSEGVMGALFVLSFRCANPR